MGDFSLAKTISIIEDKVGDDVTEEAFQDDIMPSAGDEMSAGEPNTINYYAYAHYGLYIISHCTNVTQLF